MARLCSYPSLILPWGFRGLVICSYASFIFFSWCFQGCQLVDKLSWHGCPCQFTVRVFWCQSLSLALCFTLGYQFFLFLPNVSFSLCRIMPKARTRTSRQCQVGPAAGPSRTRASPRASVRASTAASAGAARGAPASATPNATPVTDEESNTQITPQEALLSSQFMETWWIEWQMKSSASWHRLQHHRLQLFRHPIFRKSQLVL